MKRRIGLMILVLSCIFSISACKNIDEKNDTPENIPEIKAESESLQTEFESISEVYQSEDKSFTAQIIKFMDDDKNTLRISKGEMIKDLSLEEEFTTQIINVEWLNNNEYLAITSHLRPSMEQYLIVELNNDYNIETHNGFGFTWNSDFTNLYYIQAEPNYSEDSSDMILDKKGNVLYETTDGNRLNGDLRITPNGQYLMCDVYTSQDTNELFILEKQDEKTLALVAKIPNLTGNGAFLDNESLTITENSEVQTFLIKDLIN